MREKFVKTILMPAILLVSSFGILFSFTNVRTPSLTSASKNVNINKNNAPQDLPSGVATYKPTSRTSCSTSGETPENSSASFYNSNGAAAAGYYMVRNTYQALTLQSYTNIRISQLTLSMREGWINSAKASLKYSIDGGSYQTLVPEGSFASWYGSGSTFYVDITRSLDLVVNNTITFRIDTTAGFLYCNRYDITWEALPTPLEALEINKSEISLYTDRTDTLIVTPVPSTANGSVTWSSSGETIATVDSNGVVTTISSGVAIITATSLENPLIIATCTVNVTDALIFNKVFNSSELRFGATYTIGSSGTNGMLFDEAEINATHHIPTYIAEYTQDLNGIFVLDETLKFVLEPGTLVNTYSLKVVETNLYLSASNGSLTNGIHLVSSKGPTSSWEITFEAAKYSPDTVSSPAVIKTSVNNSLRQIKYHSNSLFFNTFGLLGTNHERSVELFVDKSTMTPSNEVMSITNDILYGNGNNAQGCCATVLPVLDWAIGAMTQEGQTAFYSSSDSNVISAIERHEYITEWVNLNTTTPLIGLLKKSNTNNALLLVSFAGIGAIACYYIFVKRKQAKQC